MDAAHALRIRVPSQPVHLRAVRTFLAAAARHAGCSDETIEDLRLAATEICTQVIAERSAPEGIEVRAWWDERLTVEFQPAPAFLGGTEDDAGAQITGERRRALVTALFPDVVVDTEGSGRVVRIDADIDGLPT